MKKLWNFFFGLPKEYMHACHACWLFIFGNKIETPG